MRHPSLACLMMIAAAFLYGPATSGDEQQDQGASIHGTVSASVSAFGVSGDQNKFEELHQRPNGIQAGISNFSIHLPQKGWSLDASGALLVPGYDKLNLELKKPDLGFVEFDYYRFDTYDNGTNEFYPFAPFVYHKGGNNITETRSNMGVTFGWTPQNGPKVTLRLERWRLSGDRILLRGSEVSNGSVTEDYYPLIQDLDQTRNRIILGAEQDLGNWHYHVTQMYENYEGRNTDTQRIFDATGALSQTRLHVYTPAFHDWTTTAELYGDLIKNILRLDLTGEYVTLKTTSGYNQSAFDATTGLPTSASHSEPTQGSDHNGSLQNGVVNARLTYTPNDVWIVWGGLGYRSEKDRDQSVVNALTYTGGVLTSTDTTIWNNSRGRSVMMYEAGVRVRPVDWLVGEAQGHIYRGSVDYRKMDTSGQDIWNANVGSDRDEYEASLTARPLPNVKLIGRAKHRRIDGDYDNVLLIDGGAPSTTHVPGSLLEFDRLINEVAGIVQYHALSNLYLAYKYIRRSEDFRTLYLSPSQTSQQHSTINSVSVTYIPTGKISLSGYGSVRDYAVQTPARHNSILPVPRFDGSSDTVGLDASYALTPKTSISGGLLYTKAKSFDKEHYGDLYLGFSHRISKVWTLDCRYMHSSYDESDNGGINNYKANGVTLGLTGSF